MTTDLRPTPTFVNGGVSWLHRRLGYPAPGPLAIGVFRAIERPAYDDLMAAQIEAARREEGEGELEALLHAGDTWTVGPA